MKDGKSSYVRRRVLVVRMSAHLRNCKASIQSQMLKSNSPQIVYQLPIPLQL